MSRCSSIPAIIRKIRIWLRWARMTACGASTRTPTPITSTSPISRMRVCIRWNGEALASLLGSSDLPEKPDFVRHVFPLLLTRGLTDLPAIAARNISKTQALPIDSKRWSRTFSVDAWKRAP